MKRLKNENRKLKLGSASFATVILSLLASSKSVAAPNTECGVNTFFDWGCDNSGKEQITPVLITILNWLAVGVTLAVIGGIIYGAIMYTTSGGNSQQSQKAMGIIRNAFIALVMYFAMWALLNWLVPGGLF